MKKNLLIGLLGVLVLAPSHVLSAGFSVDGATVTLTGRMQFSTMDDVTLTRGSFAPGSALVQVNGNWAQINGMFVPGTSTVTFQGTSSSTSTLSGSTGFYSLQCVTAGKTLSFTAGSTQTVAGSLILLGAVGNPVYVRSSVAGSYSYLDNSGANTVTHVDAQDNNAAAGMTIAATGASVDSGHTINWTFGALAAPPLALAGAALGVSSISWTWNAVAAATSYNVYDAATLTTLIGSAPTNTFIETGLLPNTTYGRVVTAIVGGVESSLSNGAAAVTLNSIGIGIGAQSPSPFDLLPGSPYPRILTPNRPENRRLFFLFNNPNNDSVEVSLYDSRDRKIRDLNSAASTIPGTIVWDVKDDSGRIVPGGIYLYKVKAGSVTKTGAVVVAR